MKNRSFEDFYISREKTVRREVELIHQMMLDTQAQIAQVKEDAVKDPGRAGELVHLETILKGLEERKRKYEEELEALRNQE